MITIDDVIQGIEDIMRENSINGTKIEHIQNFICSVKGCLDEGKKKGIMQLTEGEN